MMKTTLAALVISQLLSATGHAAGFADRVHAQYDLSSIPPATSVEEAKATFAARARASLESCNPSDVGDYAFHDRGFHIFSIAKLGLGVDADSVNRVLLDPASHVYSRVGSDFHDVGFLCERTGDYDFMLRPMVFLTYLFGDNPALIRPETREKLLHALLDQSGNQRHLTNFFWACGVWPETENHILMTETSRYLINQLLFRDAIEQGRYEKRYDNAANGETEWMLNHLHEFLVNDFSEYNSRPYQEYTAMALENLYEFSWDSRVKLAAQMVLNYLDAKFAVSSNGLRRAVPFRRQKAYKDDTRMLQIDGESDRFILFAGNTQHLAELPNPWQLDFGLDLMVTWALGSYRVPDPILDLVIRKDRAPYFQRFHHTGVEIYASAPTHLITAGGIWIPKFDAWTGQNSGWALPTTVMPTAAGLDRSEFIRIDGDKRDTKRINTCVAPGFACGLNPDIPKYIPESCIDRRGDWSFVDFTSERCPLHYGFYVAVYCAACDTHECREGGGRFGFLETAEPSADLDFAAFESRILAQNGQTRFRSQRLNRYYTSTGSMIEFVPLTRSKWEWGIHAIGAREYDTDIRDWPLASGDVMRADGGRVEFTNPGTGQQILLDDSDPLHPRREEYDR